MRYSKIEILRKISIALNDPKRPPLSISALVRKLPIHRATFYNHKFDKLDSIKKAIEFNRMMMCDSIDAKLYEMDNANALIALRKLYGTDNDYHRLANTRHDVLSGNKPLQPDVKLDKETVNEVLKYLSSN